MDLVFVTFVFCTVTRNYLCIISCLLYMRNEVNKILRIYLSTAATTLVDLFWERIIEVPSVRTNSTPKPNKFFSLKYNNVNTYDAKRHTIFFRYNLSKKLENIKKRKNSVTYYLAPTRSIKLNIVIRVASSPSFCLFINCWKTGLKSSRQSRRVTVRKEDIISASVFSVYVKKYFYKRNVKLYWLT